MSIAPPPERPLGLPGVTFADLHRADRLAALHARFVDDVRAVEPELWARWETYAVAPSALGAVARSNLLVAMAPHVSRFLGRLFFAAGNLWFGIGLLVLLTGGVFLGGWWETFYGGTEKGYTDYPAAA